MKTTKVAKGTLLTASIILISLMLTGISYAQIDTDAAVAIWLFDEGEGKTVIDSSNGHDGEITGDVEWVEGGKFGGAVSFPGITGNFIRIPYEQSLGLETVSMTIWVKLEQTNSWQWFFIPQGKNYYLITDGGPARAGVGCGEAGAFTEVTGTTGICDGNWHHLAGTYDKETLRLYVDGTLEAETSLSCTPTPLKNDMIIGEYSDGFGPTKGIIDELGLFSVGLEEDDIKNIMANGLSALLAVSPADKLATTWGQIKYE